MAPFEGPKSPLLLSVKHHYHSAITVVDVTFTKPSHFSRNSCMLSEAVCKVVRRHSTSTSAEHKEYRMKSLPERIETTFTHSL